jgi:EmrB/QacA subfamily drug resistance transporter
VTGYLLAMAAVIPLTGWAVGRFGAKRLYLLAITVFVIGSALSGLSWNIGTLITFRVLQGLGGGLIAPVGMTIVIKAAGPQRIGRVMAILGLPMMLGPICGPILGGYLVDAVGWRWIFYINVPIGLIALLLTTRILPRENPVPSQRLDLFGLLLLSPGLALFIFGLSNIPAAATVFTPVVLLPGLLGIALIAGFVLRALRTSTPLIDLSLLRNRSFTTAVLTMSLFAIAFYGASVVGPTYFLLVRGQSALTVGLLLVPSGIGALLTMPLAGSLTDRVGPRKIVLAGLVLIALSMVVFTQVHADTPYSLLLGALFVMGLGIGGVLMPATSAALVMLHPHQIPHASSTTTIIQQTAGAIGTAAFSSIVAGLLAGNFHVPTNQGQLAATVAIGNPATHQAAATAAASSFGHTYIWGLVLIVLCLVPASFLPNRGASKRPGAPQPAGEASGVTTAVE